MILASDINQPFDILIYWKRFPPAKITMHVKQNKKAYATLMVSLLAFRSLDCKNSKRSSLLLSIERHLRMQKWDMSMSPFYRLAYYTYEAFLSQEISPKTITPGPPCFWLSEMGGERRCDWMKVLSPAPLTSDWQERERMKTSFTKRRDKISHEIVSW